MHALNFVDLAPDIIDSVKNLLHDRFRHPDPRNHHLDPELGSGVWARRILAAVGLACVD